MSDIGNFLHVNLLSKVEVYTFMVKTKTHKAATKERLNKVYFDEIVPEVLARDPWCKRCDVVRSNVGHHRKGRLGSQDGIPLTIYAPLVMGVCTDCHTYIHKNPEESYKEGWMIRRNSGELPEGWQLTDPMLMVTT